MTERQNRFITIVGLLAVLLALGQLGHPTAAHAGGATAADAGGASAARLAAELPDPPPTGQWITQRNWAGPPTIAHPALPIFVKTFDGTDAVTATLKVSGEGVFVPSLNGRPVSPAVLEPGYSTATIRVDFSSYDVKSLVQAGENRLGMQLGTGLYAETGTTDRWAKLVHTVGPIGFNAELTITHAVGPPTVIRSDTSWQARLGGTTQADWYGGEDFDARLQPPDWDVPGGAALTLTQGWTAAVVAHMPPGLRMTAKIGPPVQVTDRIPANKITQPRPGVWVVDFGTQFAGWPQITVSGPAGSTVKLTPAETLGAGGVVSQASMTTNKPIFDRYTLRGTGSETWHPNFVYHGLRYLQLEGLPGPPSLGAVTGLVLRAANASAGTFGSSDATLNTLHTVTNRAIQSNMQSTLTDCPNREKLGWLEQDHLVFDAVAANYDISTYGRRIVQMIADSQTPTGRVPEIAPEYASFGGGFDEDPSWSGALVFLPWKLYQTYGDVGTLLTYYPNMLRYLTHLQQTAPANLIQGGLGDWFSLDPRISKQLVTSMSYQRLAATMANIAAVLGRYADQQRFSVLAASIANSINAKWLRSTGNYGPDQGSNALALDAGIVPGWAVPSTRSALLNSIASTGGHIWVGEISLPAVLNVLSALGRDDILYRAIKADDRAGYGYIVASGATAATESFYGAHVPASQNHFMLGAVDSWMSAELAGLQQAPGSVGYTNLLFAPRMVPGLNSAQATRIIPAGTISTSWSRTGNTATVTVSLPTGTAGTVRLPDGSHAVGPGVHTFTTPTPSWPTSAVTTSPWTPSGAILWADNAYWRLDSVTKTPLRLTQSEYIAYGSKVPITVPTSVVSIPWSNTLWLVTKWTPDPRTWRSVPLSAAVWKALGYPKPQLGLPAGAVVGSTSPSSDIWVRMPDGATHRLTAAEWKLLRNPRPAASTITWVQYPWSGTVWAVTSWPGAPATARRVTAPDLLAYRNPAIGTVVLVPGSFIAQWGGNPSLYLHSPDGTTHVISAALWLALGYPRPALHPNSGFVRAPGGVKTLRITDLTSGAGYWLGAAEWVAAGKPTPENRFVPNARWTSTAGQLYLNLIGGSGPIPMTRAEWVAAGSPPVTG